jgi:RHS repeat-associated protein
LNLVRVGVLQRRYVHGPGVDEPIVWHEGTGTGTRRFLMADERGSVAAVTDVSGTPLTLNTYDEYGRPGASNAGRFQYTGQVWLPEAGLYHYKARAYSAALGRFLQEDPIGFSGGINLYAYVGNDPVNFTDPSGLEEDPNLQDPIVVTACRPNSFCILGAVNWTESFQPGVPEGCTQTIIGLSCPFGPETVVFNVSIAAELPKPRNPTECRRLSGELRNTAMTMRGLSGIVGKIDAGTFIPNILSGAGDVNDATQMVERGLAGNLAGSRRVIGTNVVGNTMYGVSLGQPLANIRANAQSALVAQSGIRENILAAMVANGC